jgi:rubredoxin
MFDTLFERETRGTLKALTLEWQCPKCQGLNFRILRKGVRETGLYHTRCRYCKAKFRVSYPDPTRFIPGEDEFMERIFDEDFTNEETDDMIKDYAEIEYLKADKAQNGVIKEKEKALEDKITFAKRRRR